MKGPKSKIEQFKSKIKGQSSQSAINTQSSSSQSNDVSFQSLLVTQPPSLPSASETIQPPPSSSLKSNKRKKAFDDEEPQIKKVKKKKDNKPKEEIMEDISTPVRKKPKRKSLKDITNVSVNIMIIITIIPLYKFIEEKSKIFQRGKSSRVSKVDPPIIVQSTSNNLKTNEEKENVDLLPSPILTKKKDKKKDTFKDQLKTELKNAISDSETK